MTHLQTYCRLTEAQRALLAELEQRRREIRADKTAAPEVRGLMAQQQVYAADYLVRAATGDVLADADVRAAMEMAFEEVG